MRVAILTMILIAACGCGVSQKNLEISQIQGVWKVDFDLTMEEVKKSPKYDAEDSTIPSMIKSMMATMNIQITDTDMIYSRRGKKMSIPYTIKSSDNTSLTLAVKQGPTEATIILTLRDENHMNFTSSASDDMDYYVWERSSEKPEATNR